MTDTTCYCGSGKLYSDCCEPIIKHTSLARTPEELMRARFSAHCVQEFEFLVDSIHPAHRDGVTVDELKNWSPHVVWTGLEIHSTTSGETPDTGYVSFSALYTVKDVEHELREDSSFKKEGDHWFYVDGVVQAEEPYKRDVAKVGRNDSCPCGSGKKYKKCCGK